jgi:hypothetical protein
LENPTGRTDANTEFVLELATPVFPASEAAVRDAIATPGLRQELQRVAGAGP